MFDTRAGAAAAAKSTFQRSAQMMAAEAMRIQDKPFGV
jgi:hypothetical protein